MVTQVSNIAIGTDIRNTEHKQRVKRKQRLEFLIVLAHEPVGYGYTNIANMDNTGGVMCNVVLKHGKF